MRMTSVEGVPNAELMPPDRSRCWDHAAQLGTVGIAASEIALAQHPERETQHSRHLQTSPDISGHLRTSDNAYDAYEICWTSHPGFKWFWPNHGELSGLLPVTAARCRT